MVIRLLHPKLLLMLCCLALGPLELLAQQLEPNASPEALDSLAIAWPDNTIENLQPWAEAMLSKQKSWRILQIGDSHIQAEYSVRAMRRLLPMLLGLQPTPRGYTFPFRMYGSNEPPDFSSRATGGWQAYLSTRDHQLGDYGMAGLSAMTWQPLATLTLTLHPERGFTACPNRVALFFTPPKSTVTPLLNGLVPDTIDLKRGVADFSLDSASSSLTLSFQPASFPKEGFNLLGFSLQRSEMPLVIHAAGLNGADANSHLRNAALSRDVELLHPNIVILSLGTNDSYNTLFDPTRFADSIRTLLGLIHTGAPNAMVILSTPPDHLLRNGDTNPRVDVAAEVLRNLAIETGAALWDLNRLMGGHGSMHSWLNNGLTARDGLHFSVQGYDIQGRLLAVALFRMLQIAQH